MTAAPSPHPAEPGPDDRAEIAALYERGLYVQAYRRALGFGHPLTWRSPAACILGGRVLNPVGAPRASTLLFLRAYRQAPDDPAAAYRHAHHVHERHGPYAALERLDRLVAQTLEPTLRADVRRARAQALAELRDFSAAEDELARADLDAPDPVWASITRSRVLALADRPEEALAAAREALRLRAHFPAAVGVAADLLHGLGRLDEAAALLGDAAGEVECGGLVLQLGQLELARDRPRAAWACIERAAPLFVCPEAGLMHALAAMAAEAAYDCGERDETIRLARAADSPGLRMLADRLEAGVAPRRVRLAVPAVRQAHKTCGPATLASISLFFGEPAEHLAIADEICFDGTTIASERLWARGRGFATREFTVTWDSAVDLLDRGLPFALCTQQPTSAHAQAVIGYDAPLRVFAVRDPSAAKVVLVDADALLSAQAWCGPHGMVLAPPARAAELAALHLPDSELHELAFVVADALRVHDRARASAAIAQLQARAPGHVVTATAARELAGYDNNPAAVLATVADQLTRHPTANALQVLRLRCLAALGHIAERRAALDDLAGGHPVFDQLLAEHLLRDSRSHARAEALLRRSMRLTPEEPTAYRELGLLRLRQRRPEAGRALLRFAACLEGPDGASAGLYVSACQQAGALGEALAFLRARFERLGRRFAGPAQALYHALDSHGRLDEALAVLDEALAWRPEDGELLLFTARACAALGQTDRARELLARARGHAPDSAWQAVAAHLDVLAGELAAARARHELVLAANPLAIDAHRNVAFLDAALDGPSAALARIDAAAARFPEHAGLARLRVEWTPSEGDAGIAVVRTYHTLAPDELDGACELARRLGRRGDLAEAQELVDQLLARAPEAAVVHGIQAQLASWRGDAEAAAASLRAALHADIDSPEQIIQSIRGASTDAARQAATAHLRAELRRQISDGSGLAMYRAVAAQIDPPEQILALLEERREAQPELLAAWTVTARQLASMRRLDAALALAAEAVARFPLHAEAHTAHADLLAEGTPDPARREARIAALAAAVALAPTASAPCIAHAEALARADQSDRAVQLLTHAIRRDPLDADLHAALAGILWGRHERRAAIERLLRALEVDPADPERWQQLANMAAETGEQALVRAAAGRLAQSRPHSGWARFGVATLLGEDQRDAQLAELTAAIALDPRIFAAHDERARLLALAGEWDAALDACEPPIYAGHPPLRLRGRAAWILHQRGQPDAACALMRTLVVEDPSYAFAWGCLGDWAQARGETRTAAEAFRELLRHHPDMTHVAVALFDLELSLGDRREAGQTIARMRSVGADDQADLAELRLVLTRDGQHAALERFAEKACDPEVAPWVLSAVVDIFRERCEPEVVARQLAALVARPGAHPLIGRLWLATAPLGPLHLLTMPRRLRALRAHGTLGVEATLMYLERLANRFLGLELWCYLALEGRRLHPELRLWAIVGAVLRHQGWYRRAHRWLGDWRTRDALEPWMLRHVAAVLRWAGDREAAQVASTRALALPGVDVEHGLWLALDAAMDADPADADRSLAGIALPSSCDAIDRWVFARCKALHAAGSPLAPALRRALTRAYVDESEACGAKRGERRLLRRLRPHIDRRLASRLAAR
jgi:tetratricopeptide (TPR) repeat protein